MFLLFLEQLQNTWSREGDMKLWCRMFTMNNVNVLNAADIGCTASINNKTMTQVCKPSENTGSSRLTYKLHWEFPATQGTFS